MESKAWRHEWSTEGEQRRRWRTLDALKDDLNKINASWELTASSLSTALARLAQPSDQALSSTGPGNRGAPRSVASLTLTLTLIVIIIIYRSIFDSGCSRPRSSANAGSVMLRAEGRRSKNTCLLTNAQLCKIVHTISSGAEGVPCAIICPLILTLGPCS